MTVKIKFIKQIIKEGAAPKAVAPEARIEPPKKAEKVTDAPSEEQILNTIQSASAHPKTVDGYRLKLPNGKTFEVSTHNGVKHWVEIVNTPNGEQGLVAEPSDVQKLNSMADSSANQLQPQIDYQRANQEYIDYLEKQAAAGGKLSADEIEMLKSAGKLPSKEGQNDNNPSIQSKIPPEANMNKPSDYNVGNKGVSEPANADLDPSILARAREHLKGEGPPMDKMSWDEFSKWMNKQGLDTLDREQSHGSVPPKPPTFAPNPKPGSRETAPAPNPKPGSREAAPATKPFPEVPLPEPVKDLAPELKPDLLHDRPALDNRPKPDEAAAKEEPKPEEKKKEESPSERLKAIMTALGQGAPRNQGFRPGENSVFDDKTQTYPMPPGGYIKDNPYGIGYGPNGEGLHADGLSTHPIIPRR